jgi:hypothetical protein
MMAIVSSTVAAQTAAIKAANCKQFIADYQNDGVVTNMQIYADCVNLLHPASGLLTEPKVFAIFFVFAIAFCSTGMSATARDGERIKDLITGVKASIFVTILLWLMYRAILFIYEM